MVTGSLGAIIFGAPDGNGHPNVGALVFTSSAGVSFPYCSGALIAPDIFLTAAHCDIGDIVGTNRVQVTFDTQVFPDKKPKLIGGTFIPNPLFPQAMNDTFDIAVARLDRRVNNLPQARLPQAGQFDNLQQTNPNQQFTAVGYGGGEPVPMPGERIVIAFLDTRQVSTSSLNAVNNAWLRLSQNPATGDGGTCFGDSGGPNFLGENAGPTEVIAGRRRGTFWGSL